MNRPKAPRATSDISAIRTFLKSNPPGRIEAALFSISGIQRRRRRTVLWLRGVFLYFLFQWAQGKGYEDLAQGILHFSLAFFGILILLTFIALQLEGKRIRKISRLSGKTRITVARVLRHNEVR